MENIANQNATISPERRILKLEQVMMGFSPAPELIPRAKNFLIEDDQVASPLDCLHKTRPSIAFSPICTFTKVSSFKKVSLPLHISTSSVGPSTPTRMGVHPSSVQRMHRNAALPCSIPNGERFSELSSVLESLC